MQTEADAHAAPEESAPNLDAESNTLPAEGEADVETTTPVESLPPEPEIDPIEQWEREKAALLAQMDEEPTGEAVETPVQSEEVAKEPQAEEAGPEDPSAETVEEPEQDPEPTIEAENETEPVEKKAKQHRYRPRTPDEERAFELMREDRYQTLNFTEAVQKAVEEREALAAKDNPPEPEQPNLDNEIPEEYRSLTAEELGKQIIELRKEAIREGKESYDIEKFFEAEEKIIAMESVKRTLEHQEYLADQQFENSKQEVVNKYPVAKDSESPFAKRMADVYDAWVNMGDPRANRGDVPELIADLVAKELGVSPHSEQEPAPESPKREISATAPRPQSQVPPRKTQAAKPIAPASGGNRTQNPQPLAADVLNGIQTADEWESYKEAYLASNS